jgi:cobalt-zinc-cadmium efflux system protein
VAAHKFGNLRWEVLAAMVNGMVLAAVAVGISLEAVERLRDPREINALLFGGVAIAGLIVNMIGLRLLHGHHHHDLNVRGAYLHIVGDLLGSVGAIAAAVVIQTTGWLPADPLISACISLLILRSAWRLIRESGSILLDRVPPHVSVAEVEQRLLAVEGVERVHDVHVWTVTAGLVAMSAHAVVPRLETHPATLRRLGDQMAELGFGHVTMQLETGEPCVGEECGDQVPLRHEKSHAVS